MLFSDAPIGGDFAQYAQWAVVTALAVLHIRERFWKDNLVKKQGEVELSAETAKLQVAIDGERDKQKLEREKSEAEQRAGEYERKFEELKAVLTEWKRAYNASREENSKDREWHRNEMAKIRADLQDQVTRRHGCEVRVARLEATLRYNNILPPPEKDPTPNPPPGPSAAAPPGGSK